MRGIAIGAVLIAWLLTALPVTAVPQAGNAPPRALTDRGLENLVAFTRLLGYVRFFHPSDQAAAANWDRFAMAGVERVEGAADPQELARTLQDLFAPLAPTVQVFPTGAEPAALPAPAGSSTRFLAWSHTGVGLKKDHYLYSSRRVGELSELDNAGTLASEIDATPLRGKRVRFRAAIRAEVRGDDVARLYLASVTHPYKVTVSPEAEKTSVRGAEWREVEATLEVPADASLVRAGVTLPTGGRAWIDDVTLEVVGEGRNLLDDPGFEQATDGKVPASWNNFLEYGYAATVSHARPHGGQRSLLLSYAALPRPPLPRPGEVYQADLGGGVSARVPLSVPVDAEGHTLPTSATAAADRLPAAPARQEGFIPNSDDRATRLAAVVQAWNVLQHFYPYFDVVPADWPESLREGLRSAAAEEGKAAFRATLERLLAGLHDGHGMVVNPFPTPSYQLPLVWEWIEDRLVVTHADPQHAAAVARGSVVLSVDGRPAADVLREIEARTPAATPHSRRWKAVQTLSRGPQGEKVRLELLQPDGKTATAELARSLRSADAKEPRPGNLEELRPGVLYVDLGRMTEKDLTGEVLDRLTAARGVVFDLRGGLRTGETLLTHLTATPFARPLMQLPFVHRPDREDLGFEHGFYQLQPQAPRFGGKVAFLTDARAISAMESFLGSVEYYKLGEIVGGPTAGTNGDVNPLIVPGGYTLYWTGLRVLKQDGSRHHGVGIAPTVPVSRTRQGVIEGRDEVLEKALEVVSR